MKIALDLDGCYADFSQTYQRLIVECAGEDKFTPDAYKNPPVWNWPEHFGYDSAVITRAWTRIKSDPIFWQFLPALPGAAESLTRLWRSKHEVYFITNRPGIDTQYQSARWLATLEFHMPSVIVAEQKGPIVRALDLDVYLDDKPENIEDVWEKSPNTAVFMMRYEYNRRLWSMGENVVDSLEQFEERAKLWEN